MLLFVNYRRLSFHRQLYFHYHWDETTTLFEPFFMSRLNRFHFREWQWHWLPEGTGYLGIRKSLNIFLLKPTIAFLLWDVYVSWRKLLRCISSTGDALPRAKQKDSLSPPSNSLTDLCGCAVLMPTHCSRLAAAASPWNTPVFSRLFPLQLCFAR